MSDLNVGLTASALSALVLTALAVRGFGQAAIARILDGLFALGFLGYAGYLFQTRPDGVLVYYVFLVPVLAVLAMWPAHRRASARRFAAGFTHHPPYAEQNSPTPLTPFPAPPPPFGGSAEPDEHPRPAYRPPDRLPERPVSPGPGVTRPPIPSGLAGHHHPEQPTMPGAYQPRPSGLPAHHSAPEADEHPPARPPMPSGLPHPPPSEAPAPVEPSWSADDEHLGSARHAASGGEPGRGPEAVGFDQAPYVGAHSGEQPIYRRPEAERAAERPTEPPPPSHAEPRQQDDPRYSNYPRAGQYRNPEPQTTQFDYDTAPETSSRLRQPAYLAKYSPTEAHDEGRHRADDTAEPPRDWPPKEWPPPRG